MQNTTDRRIRLGAILSAVVIIGLLGGYLAVVLYGLLMEAFLPLVAAMILVIYGLVILAIMVGVVIALHQRLKELEGGEEADARKY